jgi:RNase H-fold protein (predicted Holliday junction resolvase)
LAVDPGKRKCGLAVVTVNKAVLVKTVAATEAVAPAIGNLVSTYRVNTIVVGDRTHSRAVQEICLKLGIPVTMVDEHLSSVKGRRRYLQEHTIGLNRLIPLGLRVPKDPFDDYVAVILAERYLEQLRESATASPAAVHS